VKTPLLEMLPRQMESWSVANVLAECDDQFRALVNNPPWVNPTVCATAVLSLSQNMHMLNVNSGWWHDPHTGNRKDRNFGELLVLTHSELSEAWLALDSVAPDDHLPQYPGFLVELGDTLIREFDWLGAGEIPAHESMVSFHAIGAQVRADIDGDGFGAGGLFYRFLQAQYRVSAVMEASRKTATLACRPVADPAAKLILQVIGMAAEYDHAGLDMLAAAFRDKLTYNQTRQDHKPEVRRQAGGKQF